MRGLLLAAVVLSILAFGPVSLAQVDRLGENRAELRYPAEGDPGQLAGGWRELREGSTDPGWFGISDSMVPGPCAAGTLPDGRPAVAFQEPRRIGRRVVLHLRVMAMEEGRWHDVAPAVDLRTSLPLRRSTAGTWGGRRFVGIGGIAQALWVGVRDGLARLHLVTGKQLVRWELRDKQWRLLGAVNLPMPDRQDITIGWDTVGRPLLMAEAFENRGEWVGLRLARWTGRRWKRVDFDAGSAKDLPLPERTGVKGRFLARGEFPICAVQFAHATTGHVCRVYRWQGEGWKPLFGPAQRDTVSQFGLPDGQRADGMPVWLWERGENRFPKNAPAQKGDGVLYFVEPHEDAPDGFSRQEIRDERFTGPTYLAVRWAPDGAPLVVGSGGMFRSGRRGDGRLVAALWGRRRGQWGYYSADGQPPYRRPFHAGHDGIGWLTVAMNAEGEALLIWSNPLPVHGPPALFGAWWRGPGVQ